MGDARYEAPLARIQQAPDRAKKIQQLGDDEVIQALAATSRQGDPYLANVLATEAMNRMGRSRAVAAHIGDGVYALDPRGRVVYVNPAAERMLGWSAHDLAGRDMHTTIHGGDADAHDECPILEPLTTRNAVERNAGVFTRKDGSRFPVSFVSAPILREGEPEGVVVAFRDATELRRTEALLAGQARVLEQIATVNAPLARILHEIAELMEAQDPELRASILLLDPVTKRLRHGAAPRLPEAYLRTIDGLQPGPAAGSCGTAAFRNEPVHVADVHASPLWVDFRHLAGRHDFQSCWSSPVRDAEGRLLGTFALYSSRPREPSPFHLDLIEVATHLAALAIEQAASRERLQTAAAVVEATSDAVITVDLHGRITGWNAGAERLYGYPAEEILGQGLSRLVPPHRAGDERMVLTRLRQGERVSGYRTQRLARDGRVLELSLTAAPLRNASGVIIGFSGISRLVEDAPSGTEAESRETERLEILRRYRLLDAPPEPELDALAQLARQICDAPIALVSLVDRDRQYFKAHLGLPVTQTPRELSFCAHAIERPQELLVVEDTHEDPRFRDNDLVTGEPHIRFYAGAPLVTTSGHALGTLCVIDRRPRSLTTTQAEALRTLARQVTTVLELRRAVADLAGADAGAFKAEPEDRCV